MRLLGFGCSADHQGTPGTAAGAPERQSSSLA
jgi:hypothetical protein